MTRAFVLFNVPAGLRTGVIVSSDRHGARISDARGESWAPWRMITIVRRPRA